MTEPTPETPSTAPEMPRPDGLPRRRRASAVLKDADEPATSSAEAAEAGAQAQTSEAEPALQRSSLEIARRIVDAAEDKKAADIVLLDVTELTTMADYFVICSGGSERQLGAIADGITEQLRDEHVRPIGREGGSNSHWVLLDFGAVVVHVFAPPERDYYQLERHWSKAKTILRVQ